MATLGESMNNLEDVKVTLGEKLRSTMAQVEAERIAAENARLAEAAAKEARHRRAVSNALADIRATITNDISSGIIPRRQRLGRVLEDNKTRVAINNPDHRDHLQWRSEMEGWAVEQGLRLEVIYAHDGMGMESWYELQVNPI